VSKSTHQIAVKATDQTAGAFASIQTRAAAASAKLRSMLGGAMAAAGAYFGFRSIAGAINELGMLSDIAQKSSVSVDDLTKSATALSVLGIQNMGPEQLAKAFQMMEKNTGRTGMEGFYQTIGEIGKIPDLSERAQAAMAVFGRSGMEFMPLINAADTSTEALQDVVNAMPGIPQSAADAGDDAADAMKTIGESAKSVWYQAIGAICGWFGKNYEGGIREAAASAGNTLIYWAKLATQKCLQYYRGFTNFFEKVGGWVGTFVGTKMAGGSWGDALKAANEDWQTTALGQDVIEEKLRANEEKRAERWRKDYENREIAIKKLGKAYKGAAKSSHDRHLLDAAGGGDLLNGGKANKITTELILGGSAKSLNLAMMGPQMQSETKKQTSILERIAKNTQKTEENTRETTAAGERFGVVNV